MQRQEIKGIILSMKDEKNEVRITELLTKVEQLDDETLQDAIMKAGGTEDSVKAFLESKLSERETNDHREEHIKINKMFSYGVGGGRVHSQLPEDLHELISRSVHLHLPEDLHELISKNGLSKTMDIVNLHLIDAIDKLRNLKDDGIDIPKQADTIYMISPILLNRELKFLETLDFHTQAYSKKQLSNEEFIKDNREAMLAKSIFGGDKSVGTAAIKFEVLETNEWQLKKKSKIEEFKSRGITIEGGQDEKEQGFVAGLQSMVQLDEEIETQDKENMEIDMKSRAKEILTKTSEEIIE